MKLSFLIASSRNRLEDLGPIPDDIRPKLQALGYLVEFTFLEDMVQELGAPIPQSDVYVMKGHDNVIQMYGALLHSQGALFLDKYPSCMAAENKILATDRLRRFGIPAPNTWITSSAEKTKELLSQGRLLLKPYIGGMGRSAFIVDVRSADDLENVDFDANTYIVQLFVEGPGHDLKLYVAGQDVFAVHKTYAPGKLSPYSVEVSAEGWMRDLALGVGEHLGLSIFGIDVIESSTGPVVVDVNYFPSFGGAAGGSDAIVRHIDRRAREIQRYA